MRLADQILGTLFTVLCGALLVGCVVAIFALATDKSTLNTSTIDITFTDGNSEVRKVSYTKIRLNESGCVQITTQDNSRYESIVCGVRSFTIQK